ncbi:MAG: carbohydrate kinase family protein [Promethearchaeota archaeon]
MGKKKLIVLGELHQDLYYESVFYEQLVEKIVANLLSFIRYNPDDLNTNILEKIIKTSFSETPKKIVGHCFFKRGGNGNNSSEYIIKLGIPTRLISVIGRGSEWMISELKELGIDTRFIFQIDEITPVSTIIKSNFTTKIHLAPNLKNKMNFEGISIDETAFKDGKMIFSTPIAHKFINLFKKASKLGLITAFNIETQKIQKIEQLNELIQEQEDIFFLNLRDAYVILDNKVPIDEIDQKFGKFAKIRIYTAGKDGSYVITDNFTIAFPGIEVASIIDRTGAGDCYAAGFLTKLYELVEDKKALDGLITSNNSSKLKEILQKCAKYATFAAIYKITKQTAPTKEEMEIFIQKFKFK